MKLIQVPSLTGLNKNSAVTGILGALQNVEEHKIDNAPWSLSDDIPEVHFKIAYSTDCIFLKYIVTEKEFRVTYQHSNDPVYKDSCVEFFISFGKEKEYYNFEFNSIGTCLAGFGASRSNRKLLPVNAIEKIRSSTSLQAANSKLKKTVTWEILIIIPSDVFIVHMFSTFKDLTGCCNFYKCGDDLEKPHFLCWNPIDAPQPDFHIREDFGEIKFI